MNRAPVERVVTKYERVYIPSSLLDIKCTIRQEHNTPRLLGAAWKSERKCRRAYEELVKGLKQEYTEKGVTK